MKTEESRLTINEEKWVDEDAIERVNRYARIVDWLGDRYTVDGYLAIDVGGVPTKYKRLESLAWAKYIMAGEV
jgi:hypothetical protein